MVQLPTVPHRTLGTPTTGEAVPAGPDASLLMGAVCDTGAVRVVGTQASTQTGGVRVPQALRAAACFPTVPDAVADAEAWTRVLRVAVQELAAAARDAGSWPQTTQTQVATALDEVTRLAAVAKAPVLAAQEASGAWRAAGVRSFEDYRAKATRAGRGAARREVNTARTVRELEGGLDALAEGTLTSVHAERLGTIAGRLPAEQKAALLTGEGAAKVKDLAGRLDANRFATRVENLAATLSARQVEETHQDARRRRHLELSPTTDGMTRVTGLLDPITGHTLQVALDAANPRPAADDQRTRGQRQADALHALAATMLAEAKGPGNARPHLLVTMTASTFAQARAHLLAASHTPQGDRDGQGGLGVTADPVELGGAGMLGVGGDPGAVHTGSDKKPAADVGPAPAVRFQDGPLLPLSELGRTLCDSQIARLVIGADSQPLELGRSQRVFTPAQRRAVIARDDGCAWDGCAMPARYCEVHHLDWWDDDHGHTDTDRGVLVCVFHHHELHRHDLDLIPIPYAADDPPPRDAERTTLPNDSGTDAVSPARLGTGTAPPGPVSSARLGTSTAPPGAATPHDGPPLPGDPDYQRPRYKLVPRSRTRARREEARRARLLAEVQADSAARKARRPAQGG